MSFFFFFRTCHLPMHSIDHRSKGIHHWSLISISYLLTFSITTFPLPSSLSSFHHSYYTIFLSKTVHLLFFLPYPLVLSSFAHVRFSKKKVTAVMCLEWKRLLLTLSFFMSFFFSDVFGWHVLMACFVGMFRCHILDGIFWMAYSCFHGMFDDMFR